MNYNIIVAGLGGDGVIFLSKVISCAALGQKMDVKCYQNHGHAKRGGSVVAHIRLGKDSFAPTVPFMMADLLFSFRAQECVRYAHFLKKDGITVVDHNALVFDEPVRGERKAAPNFYRLDLAEIIKSTGNPNTKNSAMLGFITTLPGFPLSSENCKKALLEALSEKQKKINDAAFELGRKAKAS